MVNDLYILILCGGTGPRLWPLSTTGNPKQFLKLVTKNSLLKDTVLRSLKIVPKERLYLITNTNHKIKIKKELKKIIDFKNIISEPQKKNTLTAITHGSAIVSKLNSNAVICVLPSDHYIKNLEKFKKDIFKAHKLAQSTNSIVSFGINPTKPDSSYGYLITKGQNVVKFIEKPNKKEAEKLIKQKALWNSGIYTFSIRSFEKELAIHRKDFLSCFRKLKEDPYNSKLVQKIYRLCPNISFDKAISELSKNLMHIVASFDWSDIGEWESVFQKLKKDKQGISTLNQDTIYNSLNSQNCLIRGQKQKLIGLVGVKNLAIIDTPKALLICNLDDSYEVRNLISQIVNIPKQKPFFVTHDEK